MKPKRTEVETIGIEGRVGTARNLGSSIVVGSLSLRSLR